MKFCEKYDVKAFSSLETWRHLLKMTRSMKGMAMGTIVTLVQ